MVVFIFGGYIGAKAINMCNIFDIKRINIIIIMIISFLFICIFMLYDIISLNLKRTVEHVANFIAHFLRQFCSIPTFFDGVIIIKGIFIVAHFQERQLTGL